MMPNVPDINELRQQHQAKARAEQPKHSMATAGGTFAKVADGSFRMEWPGIAVAFEVDRLRREHGDLVGELTARCGLPGARVVSNGILGATADLNFGSVRARADRAKFFAGRAGTRDLDWTGLLEQFVQEVIQAERIGQPAVDLRDLPRPKPDDNVVVEGLALPRRHPSILFGDGGAAKSYTGLWLAGRLAQQGIRTALFDWELCGEDHRERLERLFPDLMPQVIYVRCERPLVYEIDRLTHTVAERRIEYILYDSVAFACDGPPEAAEVAGRYFRAVRKIGCGSLHIAHISKSENADQKPFGSAFWHNGARSTWYTQVDDASAGTDILQIGLFNRKSNLGRLSQSLSYRITFTEDRTIFRRANIADSQSLSEQLSTKQRMLFLLRRGSMAPESVAEEIGADLETVKRTIRRHKELFTVIPGGNIALLERGPHA